MTSEQKGVDGGPVFPVTDCSAYQYSGMGLRDYMAAKAMTVLLANALDNEISFDGYDSFDGMIAELAYAQADAMLIARGQP